MYIYESPVSFPRSHNLRPPGTLSRFGEPPAPAPDLILDGFDFDRADLKKSHRGKIDQLAQRIVDSWKPGSTQPALGVRVVGHTDLVGGEDYNKDLGSRRAEKVLGRLTGLIIGGDIDTYQRMTWSRASEGKKSPRSSFPAQNRRVEVFIEWGRVKAAPPPPPPQPPPRDMRKEGEKAARRIEEEAERRRQQQRYNRPVPPAPNGKSLSQRLDETLSRLPGWLGRKIRDAVISGACYGLEVLLTQAGARLGDQQKEELRKQCQEAAKKPVR